MKKCAVLREKETVLVTGGAGFIGFHLSKRLLDLGCNVIGFDNLNAYYDVELKKSRLAILNARQGYTFVRGDLADQAAVDAIFSAHSPRIVVNLGAQAGVRYSITHPKAYMDSNITGFFHILEACRRYAVSHLVYASSSSVYGANQKVPFSVKDHTDCPVSLYAATKKSNELMAYTYSHLYRIPSTGLRFFTVYGPYGRPDMAYFSFTRSILAGLPIQIFNQGDMYRDFTYIDDVVQGLERVLPNPPEPDAHGAMHKVYNIGNHQPEKLLDFITTLERQIGREAVKEYLPMQQGDVYRTYADVEDLMQDFAFKPGTSIETGLREFVAWYKDFYKDN